MRSLALSLLLAGFLCGQSNDQQKFSVSGTVVSSLDSQPVRNALVEMNGQTQRSAMTGQDGHFQIDGVTGGTYFVSARRPGFDQQFRQQQIKVDGNTSSITVKLAPLGKITGMVLDRDGEPIEGVSIQVLMEQINNGRKQWGMRGAANSDETGAYQVEDLPAGSYMLRTQMKQLYYARTRSEAARYIYPATYYPDSPSMDGAQKIDVAAGQEAKADFTLRSARGTRVSVIPVPASGNNTWAFIGPDSEELQMGGSNNARMDKSGVLTFDAVPPGNWKITVRSQEMGANQGGGNQGGPMQMMMGEVPIDVGATDIDNVQVQLAKPVDIPVTLSGAQNSNVIVQLFGKNGMVGGGSTSVDQNGGGKIPGVMPGTYRVSVPNMGGSNCVTAITSGSQDLSREELVVTAGAPVAPIQVVQSGTCAQLTVNVNGQVQGQIAIVIVSDRKTFEPWVSAIQGGQFTLRDLSEGDYKVYAFDDVNNLEYANPEVMSSYKGEAVHLEAGQTTSVQLEMNVRLGK